MHIINSRLAY